MGNLIEAVDSRLSSVFNEQEVEQLLIVGLWCAHPDRKCRPSVRQAIHVLNFEASLPTLPPNMPVPTYCSPSQLLPTASSYDTNSTEIALAQIQHSVNKDNTDSSYNTTAYTASSSSTSILYPR